MTRPTLDVRRIVEVLERHRVAYVIVGGAAALSYGATRATLDVDCVVQRDTDNLERLGRAMRELNARLRIDGMTDDDARQLPIQLDARTLAGMELSNWTTDAGGLDVLTDIPTADGARAGYERLAERASTLDSDGLVVRVAALQDIIASKEHSGRPKDRDALGELYELRDRAGERRT